MSGERLRVMMLRAFSIMHLGLRDPAGALASSSASSGCQPSSTGFALQRLEPPRHAKRGAASLDRAGNGRCLDPVDVFGVGVSGAHDRLPILLFYTVSRDLQSATRARPAIRDRIGGRSATTDIRLARLCASALASPLRPLHPPRPGPARRYRRPRWRHPSPEPRRLRRRRHRPARPERTGRRRTTATWTGQAGAC